MEPIDHPVSRYAIGVVEGDIVAGDLVRMACERHLMDLETGADRGLYFDCQAASRIIRWARMLQHTTGPMAGMPLKLEPWQEFRHGSVFGWKRSETGLRRFQSTYHQVGKKNGKTTDTAVPMLFTQLFDGEAAPQGYCAATTKNQAGLLFKEMKRMIKRSPILKEFMDVSRTSIETPESDGLIACLSRDGDSSDGINPSFLARDEMHRWTDRELADTIVESMIARAQPIDWVITTAGQSRDYVGAGALLDPEPITSQPGLDVRIHQLRLSAVLPKVEDLVKGYDTRFAPVEMHRALFHPQTRQLVAEPHRIFKGMIDQITFPREAPGGSPACVISVASETRILTRSLASKKSDESHKARGGDRFRRNAVASGTVQVFWGEKKLE